MAFKIRDLMITDLTGPDGTQLRVGSTGARCTTRDCFIGVTGYTCSFVGASRFPHPGLGFDPGILFEQLALLKEQLKEELSIVESEQEALAPLLRPRSLAEVDELQVKLAAAMSELSAMKDELGKKES